MEKYLVVGVGLSMLGCIGYVHAMCGSAAAVAVADAADELVQARASSHATRSRLNAIDDDGDTQLHKAVKRGAVWEVEWLLDRGANPNVFDVHGYTSFYYASRGKRFEDPVVQQELVRVLYFAGADDPSLTREMLPNATEELCSYLGFDVEGCSKTLMLGSEMRSYLYEVGLAFRKNMWAFCEVKDEENPLVQMTLFPGFAGIVKEYVGRLDDAIDHNLVYIHPFQHSITYLVSGLEGAEKQAACLLKACRDGDARTVLESLFVGVDINHWVTQSRTFLHEAVEQGSFEVVKLLLENRATVDARLQHGDRFYGTTPLWRAAHLGRTQIVRLLLAHKANIDVQGELGRTVLYEAVVQNNGPLVRLLLEHSADTEIRSQPNRTPLQHAQIFKKKEMVRLLKEYKAKTKQKAKQGHKQCCIVS